VASRPTLPWQRRLRPARPGPGRHKPRGINHLSVETAPAAQAISIPPWTLQKPSVALHRVHGTRGAISASRCWLALLVAPEGDPPGGFSVEDRGREHDYLVADRSLGVGQPIRWSGGFCPNGCCSAKASLPLSSRGEGSGRRRYEPGAECRRGGSGTVSSGPSPSCDPYGPSAPSASRRGSWS